jgi:sugar phosphate isomerase/epimerase
VNNELFLYVKGTTMTINGVRLGIQSWCFRGFKTNEEVIRATKEIGLDTVEMSAAHIDLADAAGVDAVVKQYQDAGITISAISNGISNDEATARQVFDFAKKAGFSAFSVLPDPDALPLLDRLCDEYGMKVGIHNHGRGTWHRYGISWMYEEAFKHCSPNIGLCLDTAWALDVLENPVELVKRYADRLYGVHIKDFIFNRDGSPMDVVVGTGYLHLPDFFGALQEIGFNGFMSLEYEGDVNNPLPTVKECMAQLQPFADK